jgi:hypothetical protein
MLGWVGDIERATLGNEDGSVHRTKADAMTAEHD